VYIGSVGTTGSAAAQGIFQTKLGGEDFIKLLVAELQYQNPLEPMSNSDYIAQMAQFAVMEQMASLNESFKQVQQELHEVFMFQAVGLIGKEVKGKINDEAFTGVVSKINWANGEIMLTLEDRQVPFSAVTEVAQPEPPEAPEEIEVEGDSSAQEPEGDGS